jgi:hypothetical protein
MTGWELVEALKHLTFDELDLQVVGYGQGGQVHRQQYLPKVVTLSSWSQAEIRKYDPVLADADLSRAIRIF